MYCIEMYKDVYHEMALMCVCILYDRSYILLTMLQLFLLVMISALHWHHTM